MTPAGAVALLVVAACVVVVLVALAWVYGTHLDNVIREGHDVADPLCVHASSRTHPLASCEVCRPVPRHTV